VFVGVRDFVKNRKGMVFGPARGLLCILVRLQGLEFCDEILWKVLGLGKPTATCLSVEVLPGRLVGRQRVIVKTGKPTVSCRCSGATATMR
jgi:hypothetical protein